MAEAYVDDGGIDEKAGTLKKLRPCHNNEKGIRLFSGVRYVSLYYETIRDVGQGRLRRHRHLYGEPQGGEGAASRVRHA